MQNRNYFCTNQNILEMGVGQVNEWTNIEFYI